jgi:transposase
MQVEHPVCGGIDVHKDTRTACLRRVDANGQVSKEGREFATTSPSLLALSDWLVDQHCTVVAMESKGVYWKPVYHVLAGTVEVCIGNAHAMRSRPGTKTDKRDAAWIAELLAHGLIRPSFVPPPDICALRDVTRTRVAFVQTRSQSKNRVHKLLEDTNLTLGSVVSDLFGGTGRRMLAALVAGERDPQV